MIQLRSILEVADNTGARRAAMISRKGQNTDIADVGDIVTVHIKESTTDATVKKGEVAKAVVVRTKAPVRRSDGSYLRFDSNAIVILGPDGNPQGHAHLRPRRPRAARQELHEDHFARSGGPLTMQRFHVKRGDPVVVIAGSHKGKEGKVLEISPAKGRARVEGVAMIKRHSRSPRSTPRAPSSSARVPIHVSNLMLKSRLERPRRPAKAAAKKEPRPRLKRDGPHRCTIMSYIPALKKHYLEQVVPELVKLRGYRNKHEVPKLVKIILNSGIDAEADKNQIADVQRDLGLDRRPEAGARRSRGRPSRTSS